MFRRLTKLSPMLTGGFAFMILWLSLPPLLGETQILTKTEGIEVICAELRMGQYLCNLTIDPDTQQLQGCTKENIAKIPCHTIEEFVCKESKNRTFEKEIPCKWTNGYSYSTTLMLSIFLGVLGADRFYLGHVGMGALKFCTLGFLFIGQLVDIILIATHHILPKDGSTYVMGYYGPAVESLRANNFTYVAPRIDWFPSLHPQQ